jgi:hypothetical protein
MYVGVHGGGRKALTKVGSCKVIEARHVDGSCQQLKIVRRKRTGTYNDITSN